MPLFHPLRALAALALLLPAACTEILNADFDAGVPNGALPGPPPGDSATTEGNVIAAGSSGPNIDWLTVSQN